MTLESTTNSQSVKPTRVLLVGGTGRIGKSLAPLLAKLPNVILGVAGRNIDAVLMIANSIFALPVHMEDPVNEDALTELLANWDVVINVAGPEKKMVLPVLRACIRSNTQYGDIAADTSITFESFALGHEAKRAGVTALSGIGTSPAVTALLARYAIEKLETVDELVIGYIYPTPDPEQSKIYRRGFQEGNGSATWQIELAAPIGTTNVKRNGKIIKIDDSWTNQRPLVFPFGPSVMAVPCDYPEVLLIDRKYPEIPNVSLVVQFDSELSTAAWENACRELKSGTDINSAGEHFFEAMSEDFNKTQQLVELGKIPVVNAIGTYKGRKASFYVRTTEWVNTEYVAVAMCEALISGRLPHGVYTGEDVFDPLPFIQSAYELTGNEPPSTGVVLEELVFN